MLDFDPSLKKSIFKSTNGNAFYSPWTGLWRYWKNSYVSQFWCLTAGNWTIRCLPCCQAVPFRSLVSCFNENSQQICTIFLGCSFAPSTFDYNKVITTSWAILIVQHCVLLPILSPSRIKCTPMNRLFQSNIELALWHVYKMYLTRSTFYFNVLASQQK